METAWSESLLEPFFKNIDSKIQSVNYESVFFRNLKMIDFSLYGLERSVDGADVPVVL